MFVEQRAASSSILGSKLLQLKYITEKDLLTIGLEDAEVIEFEFELESGLLGSLLGLPLKKERNRLQQLGGVRPAHLQVLVVFVVLDGVATPGDHRLPERC